MQIAKWTNESAFNLGLAMKESQNWIESVTEQKFTFADDFQKSLKDGRLLCK